MNLKASEEGTLASTKVSRKSLKKQPKEEKSSIMDHFCTNPCCCVNQEKGAKIVSFVEFIIGIIFLIFGLLCVIGIDKIREMFGEDKNSRKNKKDIEEDVATRLMIRNIGWSNVAFGFCSLILAFLLYTGVKKRKRRYCQIWAYAEVVAVFLQVAGMIGGSVMLEPEDSSIVLNNTILLLLSMPLMLLPFQLYLIYVVSLYSLILSGVERRLEIMAMQLHNNPRPSSTPTIGSKKPSVEIENELGALLAKSAKARKSFAKRQSIKQTDENYYNASTIPASRMSISESIITTGSHQNIQDPEDGSRRRKQHSHEDQHHKNSLPGYVEAISGGRASMSVRRQSIHEEDATRRRHKQHSKEKHEEIQRPHLAGYSSGVARRTSMSESKIKTRTSLTPQDPEVHTRKHKHSKEKHEEIQRPHLAGYSAGVGRRTSISESVITTGSHHHPHHPHDLHPHHKKKHSK